MEKSPQKPISMSISREAVKDTEAYKSQSKMMQVLTLGKTSVESIQNGLNISLNRGYEYWESISHARWQNKEIVQELLKNTKK